jgi:hypothetical protein
VSSAEQSGPTNARDSAASTPEVDQSPVSGSPATEPTFVYDPLAPDPESTRPGVAGAPATPEDDSTVGTGTSIALGCIAGTMVLIVFAILILFIYSVIVN